MGNNQKLKEKVNPEIIREEEEKRKTDALYSGERDRKLLLLYALFAVNGAYTSASYGIGAGALVPPILFWKLFD